MSKYTTIEALLQECVSEKDIKIIAEKYGYKDKGRKVTVIILFRYFLLAAILKSSGFRELRFQGTKFGLPFADYSTLSKKAKEVPYEIFQELCNLILEKATRKYRRKLEPIAMRLLAAIDSTRITAPKSKLEWSPFEKGKSGIKYHVKYGIETKMPIEVHVSPINTSDSAKILDFKKDTRIFVCDRGYRSVEKLVKLDKKSQSFVVRMKEEISMHNIRQNQASDSKYEDVYCTLGKDRDLKSEYRNHEFRVIKFMGKNDKLVMLCTNLKEESSETIAEMYRKRWSIECFFKVLKQNFEIKKIFGTTENAVYSQGLIAFIAYAITFCLYTNLSQKNKISVTYPNFLRLVRIDNLSIHLNSFRHSLLLL